jgi:hypothetical protein
MKTKLLLLSLYCCFRNPNTGSNRTSVNAMNSEISDNLDLRAVASIFETLEIFKILNDG